MSTPAPRIQSRYARRFPVFVTLERDPHWKEFIERARKFSLTARGRRSDKGTVGIESFTVRGRIFSHPAVKISGNGGNSVPLFLKSLLGSLFGTHRAPPIHQF